MKHAKPPRRNLATRTYLKQPSSLTPFMQWLYGLGTTVFEASVWAWGLSTAVFWLITAASYGVDVTNLDSLLTLLDKLSVASSRIAVIAGLTLLICLTQLVEVREE